MKKLLFLFAALAALTLKAQDTSIVTPKYEYAFVYANLTADSLNIYFDNGKVVNISEVSNSNYIKNPFNSYSTITRGFDFYVKAFNYLQLRGYEFMGTGSYIYGNVSMSYYIYRKTRQQ